LAGSDDQEQEQLNDPPPQYMYPLTHRQQQSHYVSGLYTNVVTTASSYTNWQNEKRELEEMIRQQAIKIDKVQADLNAKKSQPQQRLWKNNWHKLLN
jgi:hypothetical protein